MTTLKGTCWSITINNPTEQEVNAWTIIPGWHMEGQYEQGGKTGTRHFQGALKTPQVRLSAVKRVFPRAHIEPARNAKALAIYVNKEDTRVEAYQAEGVPTIFEYQRIVANEWDNAEFTRRRCSDEYLKRVDYDVGNLALQYVDEICAKKIEQGALGLEFIAINPMWRSSWKKFYSSIITRNATPRSQASAPPPPQSPEAQPQPHRRPDESDLDSGIGTERVDRGND